MTSIRKLILRLSWSIAFRNLKWMVANHPERLPKLEGMDRVMVKVREGEKSKMYVVTQKEK